MKKSLKRILEMFMVIISLGYNFCYADVIAPKEYTVGGLSIIETIIVGIIIAIIVTVAIVILSKNKKQKEEKNDEK